MDKIKNETKKITIERYNIIGESKKILQSSKVMNKINRVIQVKIISDGSIYNKVLDLYLECGSNPIYWKKVFMRIVKTRPQRFIQNCCECTFVISMKDNTTFDNLVFSIK